jgi:hypothetical protein
VAAAASAMRASFHQHQQLQQAGSGALSLE